MAIYLFKRPITDFFRRGKNGDACGAGCSSFESLTHVFD